MAKKRVFHRDKIGRFMKRPKKVKRVKAVRKPKVVRRKSVPKYKISPSYVPVKKKRTPAFTVRRGVPARGGREFVQRYFIDKFKKGKQTEWEVWTIASKGTPPLQSKRQVLKKVESIM